MLQNYVLDFATGPAKVSPALTLADLAHSAAATFLPSAPRTRFAWMAPPPAAIVMPLASTARISPGWPLPDTLLASKISTFWPLTVDQAPGAGLAARMRL